MVINLKNLIIIGVGGFAREVYWHAQQSNAFLKEWQIKGFLDGDIKLPEEEYKKLPENVPVLGDVDNYEICEDDVFICAIGTPQVRKKLIEKMLARGAEFVSIINNRSSIFPSAKIGRGVIICLDNGVGDNVEVSDFVVINNSSYLGHDVKVGKYSCIMSHVDVGGFSQIGEEVFIASHVAIIPKVKIENGAYIGTGSVVLRKVKANAKVFGNPAMEF